MAEHVFGHSLLGCLAQIPLKSATPALAHLQFMDHISTNAAPASAIHQPTAQLRCALSIRFELPDGRAIGAVQIVHDLTLFEVAAHTATGGSEPPALPRIIATPRSLRT